jgi:23S rRNA (cytidine1920-2'-O)/16S rRNA (cytidine1409-2'-O)-methyltransferase
MTGNLPDEPASQPPGKTSKVARERLDVLLVRRGLAPSRERARALLLTGEVRVIGRVVTKAGTLVPPDAPIELVGPSAELRYVSRGGLKLERALDAFSLSPACRVCLDVGASTGGFTDVLLRRGATRVYAVDVGRGQLAWSLRRDARVVVLERTNIRTLASLPEEPACATIDVSFISLRLALPRVAALLAPGGWVVALVKPQFEAGRVEADRGGGVIADPAVHSRVLRELLDWLARWSEHTPAATSLVPVGLIPSPILGREGNREYLLELVAQPAEPHAAQGAGPSDLVRCAPAFQGRDCAPSGEDQEGEPIQPIHALIESAVDAVVAAAFAPDMQAPHAPPRASGRIREHRV